jgi:hypothetical protein
MVNLIIKSITIIYWSFKIGIQNIPENITNILPITIKPINSTFVNCQEENELDDGAILAM